MDFEAVAKYVLDKFKAKDVRSAVIGGFALHAAGFPRATQDIDFLVHVDDVPAVKSILWLIKNHKGSLNIDLLREYFGIFGQTEVLEGLLKNA